jgi:hypothetical protein
MSLEFTSKISSYCFDSLHSQVLESLRGCVRATMQEFAAELKNLDEEDNNQDESGTIYEDR